MATINSWLKFAKTEIDSLDAELVLLHVLNGNVLGDGTCLHEDHRLTTMIVSPKKLNSNLDRSYLIAHGEQELTHQHLIQADNMLFTRFAGVPLAYVLGYKEFYGRNFLVSPDVLIPRPETEDVITLAKSIYQAEKEYIPKNHDFLIFDIGTGYGCIAITLKLEIKKSVVIASDINKKALTIAAKNANCYLKYPDSSSMTAFDYADLLHSLTGPKKITARDADLIIANLPYVNPDWDFLSPSIQYEPASALYAKNNGLELIYKLIDQIYEEIICNVDFMPNCYKKFLILEADLSQQEDIVKYAKTKGLSHEKTLGYCMS